ncbi:MAG TPA: DNA polymerase III subunit epsilon [Rhizomicrobium sp.]|jgi:DNA polymerase-3 subunit epsilon|nr:DNA polymerase III subunit epsilon [Rhizomicrobium sp.]
MREIVLDTETTGLDPADGHRIVEIGCVELFDHLPTGVTFQCYLNPERLVGDSERIHGISDAHLVDKPLFAHVADEFVAFIGDAPLIIHNASFDLKFLNFELQRAGRPHIPYARAIDTIEIAKSKIPGARYSLDELCKRFAIDLSVRTKHGALLDAQLTAQVYLELAGGRQTRFKLAPGDIGGAQTVQVTVARIRPTPLPPRLSEAEAAAHAQFAAKELGDNPVWNWF